MGTFEAVFMVARAIERAIQASEFPRPTGFRTRAVVGPCWRIDYGVDFSERDYLGYYVNFCSRLLALARGESFIVSDSVRQTFAGRRGFRIRFERFDHSEPAPHGVDAEDLKIWRMTFRPSGRLRK